MKIKIEILTTASSIN